MSILITGTSETIAVALAAAPTANQLHVSASWADQGGTGGDASLLTSGVTAITAVAAPAAGISRVVSGLSIYNADTADAVVVVSRKVGANYFTLAKVILPAGGLLGYANASGWKVLDQNGALVQTVSSGAGGGATRTMNEQVGASYTLAIGDATKDVRCTNAAAISLVIPKNTTAALPLYAPIAVFQGGAGTVTITGDTGVSIKSPFGASTTVIEDFRVMYQRATDVWVIG